MNESERYRWVALHILPFESEVRGWLHASVRSLAPADIDDLIQEALARIWSADLTAVRQGRSYLFATIRNLLAERARRHRIVPIELRGEIDTLPLISDELGPERRVGARQELECLRRIVAELPAQCRRVFELRRLEGLSQREIAQHMGLAEKTVENHLTRALTRINEAMGQLQDTPADRNSRFGMRVRSNDPD